MLTLQVHGQAEKVESLVNELRFWRQMDMISVGKTHDLADPEQIRLCCLVEHRPHQRIKVVKLETVQGSVIHLPIIDLIHVEMEEGVHIFSGRHFDIFSSRGGGE